MGEFSDRLITLREQCVRCWADEFSDIFPQGRNLKIASEEMKKYGNPPHSKRCQKNHTLAEPASGEGEK